MEMSMMSICKWIGERFAALSLEREKRKSQQQVESHKAELRRLEFRYPKEVKAAEEFMALHSDLRPRYRFREMEWEDACSDFALAFEKVEERLEQYKATHGAILQSETFHRLSKAITNASSGKFEVRGDDVSSEGINLADEVMKELEAIEKELRKAVRSKLDEQQEPEDAPGN